MIELARHIETLLLENDCVIVPDFGGFITHYNPATLLKKENLFLPPVRTIGFNPQLKLNDGVLVQSFMATYDTNFADASKRVEKQVNELIELLQEEGKVDLENIGILRYTVHHSLEFSPYDHKIVTPSLYGLDSFEMEELSRLKLAKEISLIPISRREKKTFDIRISRTLLRNAIAAAAVVILFFAFSTPIENTYIEKSSYARLLPVELFEKIEKQSVAMTPVLAKGTSSATPRPAIAQETEKPDVTDTPSTATTSPEAMPSTQQPDHRYYIIVAGGISLRTAETMAEELRKEGFTEAKAIRNQDKTRVSICSCSTREEAMQQLLKIRKNENHQNAWLLTE